MPYHQPRPITQFRSINNVLALCSRPDTQRSLQLHISLQHYIIKNCVIVVFVCVSVTLQTLLPPDSPAKIDSTELELLLRLQHGILVLPAPLLFKQEHQLMLCLHLSAPCLSISHPLLLMWRVFANTPGEHRRAPAY